MIVTQTPADAWPPLIPVWLLVSGCLIMLAPAIYSLYDVFCKQEEAASKGETQDYVDDPS